MSSLIDLSQAQNCGFSSMRWLIPNMLIGSDLPNTREKTQFIIQAGVKAVISLCLMFTHLEQMLLDAGVEHISIISDPAIPRDEQKTNALHFFLEQRRRGNLVLMHCHAGVGRTGSFARYIIQKTQSESWGH